MYSYIRRYDANPTSTFLEDRGAIPDPDFWSNQHEGKTVPVWAVCGPRPRDTLEKGDRVFFTPMKSNMNGEYEYICTGALVVEEKLSLEDALASPRLNDDFKSKYMRDLLHSSHLIRDIKKDNSEIAKKRIKNIIIGNPEESVWFGDNDLTLETVLKQQGKEDIADSVANATRQPKRFRQKDSDLLYDALVSELDERNGRPGASTDTDGCRACRGG
ncbi:MULTISPECIES: hypothetical protein [Halorussus]|uniref:hypothetical protein n=1 Tax=Halorussus TaxID=1070314 RepID=UPI00209E4037|nr:hypothetical protein [Halorussus vallis]USZ77208.1 hypothetical protein NGM07_07720 [Halorussus vallis]